MRGVKKKHRFADILRYYIVAFSYQFKMHPNKFLYMYFGGKYSLQRFTLVHFYSRPLVGSAPHQSPAHQSNNSISQELSWGGVFTL